MATRPTGDGEDLLREEIARRLHTSQARLKQEEEIEKAKGKLGTSPTGSGAWKLGDIGERQDWTSVSQRSRLK